MSDTVTAVSTTLRSNWTTTKPQMDGLFDPREWTDAAVMNIPEGLVLAKNDATTLWLAFDLVNDTTPDPGTTDGFLLYIDVDEPTLLRDLVFGVAPDHPHQLGRWVVSGPATLSQPIDPFAIESRVRQGFGPTQRSATPHRFWELALKLEDIDPSLTQRTAPAAIRFALRFTPLTGLPRNFDDFADLVLAIAPKVRYDKPGALIGGVGTIDASQIDAATGLATVRREYEGFYLVNAAFGGTLDFYANAAAVQTLLKQGAATFGVRHRRSNGNIEAEPWSNLVTSWINYRWNGTRYDVEAFGPDATSRYRLVDPNVDYALTPLLFRWPSQDSGLHQFEIDVFDAGGAKLAAPKQRLTLFIDNTPPSVQITGIETNGRPGVQVKPGETLTMTGPYDCLWVSLRAEHPKGLLEGYQAMSFFGDKSQFFAQDYYTWRMGVNPPPTALWPQDSKCCIYIVPKSGTYWLRLNAIARITDGYRPLPYYAETSRTITIEQPYPDRSDRRVSERYIDPPRRTVYPIGYTDEGRVERS